MHPFTSLHVLPDLADSVVFAVGLASFVVVAVVLASVGADRQVGGQVLPNDYDYWDNGGEPRTDTAGCIAAAVIVLLLLGFIALVVTLVNRG